MKSCLPFTEAIEGVNISAKCVFCLFISDLDGDAFVGRLVAGISDDTAFADVLVGDAHGDAALGVNELDEVDNLSLVSIRVTIGEGIRDVVGFDASFGGKNERGLGVIVSLNHSVGAHDLDSLIVSVLGIAMQVDGGGDSGGELEQQDDSVIVVHLLNLLEPSLSRGINLNGVLSNQPAMNVDIMGAAVVEDATRGLEEFEGGQRVVARSGADDLNISNLSIDNGLLELHERRVKATLEAAKEGKSL